MRWIYLSPHLDDAILSAGGLMYEQARTGIPVEVWTIMAGIPVSIELTDFAQMLHREWGTGSAEETIRVRRAENEKAAGFVCAKAIYFEFPDSLYRCGPGGEALYTNSFGELHEAEADLPERIAEAISRRLEPDDMMVCPLALGGHVDHVIMREAAELLERPLLYCADIPYLLNKPRGLRREIAGMKESIHPVSEAGLRSWLEASCAYVSQIKVEFNSPELLRKKLSSYWAKHKGIRLWMQRKVVTGH